MPRGDDVRLSVSCGALGGCDHFSTLILAKSGEGSH
jgi:hypothetical protein